MNLQVLMLGVSTCEDFYSDRYVSNVSDKYVAYILNLKVGKKVP